MAVMPAMMSLARGLRSPRMSSAPTGNCADAQHPVDEAGCGVLRFFFEEVGIPNLVFRIRGPLADACCLVQGALNIATA